MKKLNPLRLGVLALCLVGAVVLYLVIKAGPKPEVIVQEAFDAYRRGNSSGVDDFMSPQGLANAGMFCNGAAIQCLEQNYANNGEVRSVITKLLSNADGTARVELRTAWSSDVWVRCQTYTLDKTDGEWRITFFSPPYQCSSP